MGFSTVSLLGVGLLGGSIGLAIRAAAMDCKIIGYGHRRQSLDAAIESAAIDHAESDPVTAVTEADLIILCTPVGTFGPLLKKIAQAVRPGAIVTDVGSTKRSIVQLGEEILAGKAHFVGSHPMAGSEKRGVEYARADLFVGATCILTPTEQTDPHALRQVREFWQTLRMRCVELSPEDHDRRLADISHLPHALAAALVAMQSDEALPLSGKGFLDTTRIASGDGGLWRDIFYDNADNLRTGFLRLRHQIDEFLQMLDDPQHPDALRHWLDAASLRREALVRQKLRDLPPD